jgi:hypothetical protein
MYQSDTHVKGVDQRINENNELIPVESRDGVEAESTDAPSNRSEMDVVGGNPRHPVEVA